MLNPGCVLRVGLMEGRGQEGGWPGLQGAQDGRGPGQVVVVDHQRPLLLHVRLLLLLLLTRSLTLQVDLRIVQKGRADETGSSSPCPHSVSRNSQF